jgi:L-amino acid N-acyltransferase YncA
MTVAARIGVRAATTADAESVAAIYAPVVTGTAISFEEKAPGPDEIGRRMLASPRLPWVVADDAGRVAGYAYASTHRQRPAYRCPRTPRSTSTRRTMPAGWGACCTSA